MREKIFPAVFLMLVLLIGFPSSVANFAVFADDDDDDNDNLYVSSEKFEDAMEDAQEAIDDAKEEIEKAQTKIHESEGKEITLVLEQLDEAKEKLAMAEHSFALGNFEKAEELAEEAEDLAEESTKLIGKTQSNLEAEHEIDEHEVEIKGKIDEINLESMFFTLVGSILQIFVNKDTEFENFDEFSDLKPRFQVEVEVVLSGDSHVATEIEIEDNGDEKYDKVTLCHIPKGNPSNAYTITVGASVYGAHIAHVDLEGPCVDGDGTIHDKYEEKLNKKLAKLDKKRAELEQKQNELAEILVQELGDSELTFAEKQAKKADKLALKLERLSEKYDELQAKYSKKSDEIQQNLLQNIDQLHPRTQKLLEKLNTGEYFGDLHEDEDEIRKYVLSFDSLIAEPFGQSSETSEFSADITLTSSSSGSSGNLKFKVTGCSIIGEEVSYSCAFGKARTVSSGTSGNEEKLAIMALLQDDDSEFTPSLKIFVTPTDSSIASLVEGSINVSIHSEITLQWSISGEGTLTILDSGEATHENN